MSVTSSIVLIALLKSNSTKFLVASNARPPGTRGIIPGTMKIILWFPLCTSHIVTN